jgi:hypothetical protein
MKLSDRMHRYLLAQNKWVIRDDIARIARSKGYAPFAIGDALRNLEKHVDVGLWYFDPANDRMNHYPLMRRGQYYRVYPMSPEEIQQRKDSLAYFDSL